MVVHCLEDEPEDIAVLKVVVGLAGELVVLGTAVVMVVDLPVEDTVVTEEREEVMDDD